MAQRKGASLMAQQVHEGGLCSITYDIHGAHLITAGSDALVKIFEVPQPGAEFPEEPLKVLEGHKMGVTALQMSPKGVSFASASLDPGFAVKLWSLPGTYL